MNDIKTIEVEGAEVMECVVRNIGSNPVLFTKCGKIIGHQVDQAGYEYYYGKPPNRRKTIRMTFLVDEMNDAPPSE